MTDPVRANVWKINLIAGLRMFMLSIPILVLFFLDNGLTMTEVLLLQGIFSIIVVFTEIPSGYFADKYGRKRAIVVGTVLAFLGFVAYSLSFSFFGFMIAEILLGFSASFISGADSALLYDSLKQSNEEKLYTRLEGLKGFFGSGSEAVASVAGGLLALSSLRLPFYIHALIMLLAIPVALSLKETSRQSFPKTGEFTSMRQIIGFSLFTDNKVKWLIYYFAVVSAATLSVIWYIQPYLKNLGFGVFEIALAWAALQLFTAVLSAYAYKIELLFSRKYTLLMLIPLSALGYILVGSSMSILAATAFLIFYFVRAVNQPILKNYINQIISSDIRATVLSIKNMVARLTFALIGPFIAWLNDIYSLQIAFYSAAGMFLLLGVVSVLYLKKYQVINT